MNIGVVILAAGGSSRMGGQPKQLIEVEGKTLLRRVVDAALDTDLRPVVVVVGANKDRLTPELHGLPITLIDNPFWQQGLSSSVKTGLAGLYLTQRSFDAVLFLLTDQPFVSSGLLKQMVHVFNETGKPLVACRYDGHLGVPALLSRDFVQELLALEGDRGARWLIEQNRERCAVVEFEAGRIDLDTPDDVRAFRAHRPG